MLVDGGLGVVSILRPDGINDLKLYRKYSLFGVCIPAADGVHCAIFISTVMN